MAEPIESHCRVGVVHYAAYPACIDGDGPILESLARVAEDDFFGAVEVAGVRNAAARREARDLLADSHMDVILSACPTLLRQKLNLNATDRAERQKALELCQGFIDQAYELGARILVVASGPDPGETRRTEAREILEDSLKQLCRYAQEQMQDYILALSVETMDRDIQAKRLLGPTHEAAGVIEAVKAEYSNVGLTLDLSHQPLLRETISDMLVDAADTMIHGHFGNCVVRDPKHPLYGDQHPPFGIPEGENDVEELRVFLEALIYSGFFAKSVPTTMPVLSMEIRPSGNQRSEVMIANGKRTLKEAWARLSHDKWAAGRI
jgi:sugar phosphate isomerase/epimerase